MGRLRFLKFKLKINLIACSQPPVSGVLSSFVMNPFHPETTLDGYSFFKVSSGSILSPPGSSQSIGLHRLLRNNVHSPPFLSFSGVDPSLIQAPSFSFWRILLLGLATQCTTQSPSKIKMKCNAHGANDYFASLIGLKFFCDITLSVKFQHNAALRPLF